jgi:effector-binding domain-containing protein
MAYDIEIVDLPEQHGPAVVGRCPWNNLAAEIGRRLRAIREGVRFKDQAKTMPFVLYRDPSDADVELAVGFLAEDAADGSGKEAFQEIRLPPGRAAKVVHKGAYNQLGQAHDALFDWARAKGYHAHGGSWELYVNSPEDNNADEVRTEVFLPLP